LSPDHFSDGERLSRNCSGRTFPEIYAKNGELFHTVSEIPDIITLIAQIRYKMAPKMIPIGAFWLADRFKIGL
jgi:hypothetical protein